MSTSHVTISLLAEPQSVNIFGSVHGGWILRQVDHAAYVAAARFAGRHAVTASIDRVDFRSPIRIGDLVTLEACVAWVGRTSMVISVTVRAEDLLTREVRHTNSCLLTFVAVDAEFNPVPVPGLVCETAEEKSLWEEIAARRSAEGR